MIVAVIAMRMMEVVGDEVVDVIPMRHSLVAALRSVLMRLVVAPASMVGRAVIGVIAANVEAVLLDTIRCLVVQVAIVQVINVIRVAYGRVAAGAAVLMIVIGVGLGR